jgi:hypothetical protein
VVYSKGDLMGAKLKNWPQIREYLKKGSIENLENFKLGSYLAGMKKVSSAIKKFTRTEIKAQQFLNFAKEQFKSVEFCIISSLGSKPQDNRLQVEISPKCIMDPLIWILYRSLGWFKKYFLT